MDSSLFATSQWWSQPLPPDGGQVAEGLINALGRPSLDMYTVLVRETIQNSWDARLKGPMRFGIKLKKLGEHVDAWNEAFKKDEIASLAKAPGEQLAVGGEKWTRDDWLLIISDRNTEGLGGPLRADVPARKGSNANFVQFIRNMGEPRDKDLGGGTFGVGKTILFAASSMQTILVDSKNRDGDENERRLIGAALTESFDTVTRRFTGRHWWGTVNEDVVDPFVGNEAAQISNALGLPGFGTDDSGTDIAIVAPRIDDDRFESADEVLKDIRAAIYWNAWAKMASENRPAQVEFSIEFEGKTIPMPPVDGIQKLESFSYALDVVDRRVTEAEYPVAYRLKKYTDEFDKLGQLAVFKDFKDSVGLMSADARDINERCPENLKGMLHHVARMRQAELVVDYFSGPEAIEESEGYAGVFKTSVSTDAFFADSEPQTHDAWESAGLELPGRSIVKLSTTFINEQLKKLTSSEAGPSKTVQGLGRLASSLGKVLSGAPGTRVTAGKRKPQTGGVGGGGRRNRFRVARDAHLVVRGSELFVEAEVTFTKSADPEMAIEVQPVVVLAGGAREKETDRPMGSDEIKFLGWFDPETDELITSERRLLFSSAGSDSVIIRACNMEDAAIDFKVSEASVDGE